MHPATITPDLALQMLVEGNRRFTTGQVTHPNQSAERRAEVLAGQHPIAILLSCSDSRVPPEVFFDQGIGDLFIIRNAGSVVDDVVLGSIEYAIEHLGAPLVVILGHTKCGAVTATVQGGLVPGHIGSLVDVIKPAAETTQNMSGDPILNATWAHVRNMVLRVKTSQPILAPAARQNHILVTGGVYHLESGAVEFI